MENNNIDNNNIENNTENNLNNENISSENNTENNNSEQEKNEVLDAEYTVLDSETDKNFSFFDPVEDDLDTSENDKNDTDTDSETDTDTADDFSDIKTGNEDKIFGDILATLIDGLFSFLIFSVIYSKIEFSENEEKKIMPSERALKTLKEAWAKLSAYYSWGNKSNPILMVIVATVAVYTASFATASKIAKRKKKNTNDFEQKNDTTVANNNVVLLEKRGRGRPKGSKNKVFDTENV